MSQSGQREFRKRFQANCDSEPVEEDDDCGRAGRRIAISKDEGTGITEGTDTEID